MDEKFRVPSPQDQKLLESLQARLLEPVELERCNKLLDAHHYLGSPKPVGERLYYVISDLQGEWLAYWSLLPQPSISNIGMGGLVGPMLSGKDA